VATGLRGDDPNVRAKVLKDLVAKRTAARGQPYAGPMPLTSPAKGKARSIAAIQPRG
jgi:hypothetical protein